MKHTSLKAVRPPAGSDFQHWSKPDTVYKLAGAVNDGNDTNDCNDQSAKWEVSRVSTFCLRIVSTFHEEISFVSMNSCVMSILTFSNFF